VEEMKNKSAQRKAMKALCIAQCGLDEQGRLADVLLSHDAVRATSAVSRINAIRIIRMTPVVLFRSDKPSVDKRRQRRAMRCARVIRPGDTETIRGRKLLFEALSG